MFSTESKTRGRILLIDDDQNVTKVVKKFLERVGHSVDTAASGEEGIRLIGGNQYDMVITDIYLPGMDGMAVLDKIKSINPELDIVVITGYGSIESAVSFMKAGAIDYISKPINLEHLDIVIRKTLERKELIKAARERDIYFRMSLTDALTGMFNHKYFQDSLEREILYCRRKTESLTIMMADIDGFKAVNDDFGHQAGDMVLQKISMNILKACRSHDTVSRYGGEEFGIILPETGVEKSMRVAERMLNVVGSQSYPPVNRPITISIGIASFPEHAYDREELIQKADLALYHSKGKGRNRFTVYDGSLEPDIRH
ncbi:MAG: diguanylate cyclase [Spirochaetota bacterium]|jgi:two-component system cell cycle response regulator|nr:diguanylate cyclase [Spirochaetota bacterium]